MKKELIIFDLDGTLLDTIGDLATACNYALSAVELPTHDMSEYPALVGNGINKLIERALPADKRTEEWVMKVRGYFVSYYDAHNCLLTKPYPGISEVLHDLKRNGIKLAVASNKYQKAAEKIVNHFFPGVFDMVVGERPNCPRKPNPQCVLDIMRQLNVTRAQTLYIGDSTVDEETAMNAGIDRIRCGWGFEKIKE